MIDLARAPAETGSVPVDLACVQHTVTASADVDERCFHTGQHVLDAAQVHVADHRRGGTAGDEMLDEHAVFEHGNLCGQRMIRCRLLAHDHDAVDGFAARQELGLGEDRRTTTAGIAPVAATLTFGLEARRARDSLNLVPGCATLVAWLTLVHDGVGRIVLGRRAFGSGLGSGLAPAPATATAAGAVSVRTTVVGVVVVVLGSGIGLVVAVLGRGVRGARVVGGVGRIGVLTVGGTAAST